MSSKYAPKSVFFLSVEQQIQFLFATVSGATLSHQIISWSAEMFLTLNAAA